MTVVALLAAIAAFAGALGIAGITGEDLRRRRARDDAERRRGGVRRPPLQTFGRLGRLIASATPIRRLPGSGDLEARLVAAGEPAGFGTREWMALKSLSAAGGGIVTVLAVTHAPLRIALLLLLVAPAVGFVLPDLWLARRSRLRVDEAIRELPDMLDLLRVTVEAGMPPARAIGVVGTEFRGTMAREWRRVAAEVQLGVAGHEVFASLFSRLPADEVGALVESLTRAGRHGVPLGRALDIQAAKAREHRRRLVRERAARAGPKIQLVVALLLVPSALLMVAAGLLVELERSGSWVGAPI